MKVEIDKEVLFKLLTSHSSLAQAEYNRNPTYNDKHPSHVAEVAMIKELSSIGIYDEFLVSMDS